MLKRVSIQNFKSLKDVTLDLQKVNLLIGPNNSGKTNFLKALEFIDRFGSGYEIDNIGRAIYSKNRKRDFAKLSLIYDLPYENTTLYSHYTIAFTESKSYLEFYGTSRGIVRIEDYISINNNFVMFNLSVKENLYEFENFLNFPIDFDEVSNTSDFSLRKEHGKIRGSRDSLEIGQLYSTFVDALKINLNTEIEFRFDNLQIYRPDPNKFSKPAPVGRGENFVYADASNLVSYLDFILGRYRKTIFNRIENDLHFCIPEFDEVTLDDTESSDDLRKQFGDKSFKRLGLTNSAQGITYWADELSEGTLYFIALLCIIHQPNPPKLLLLEEPEKGIHPRRIWEVMKFIFQLAEEKDVQIILTTHNEHVVNAFSSMPEAVFVFDKDEEGATHVRNLQTDIIEPSHQRSRENGLEEINFTENLGENWLYGLLGGVPTDND